MSRCESCNVKGDIRFIFAPCHISKEKYHPEKIENYHPGNYKSRMIHTGQHKKRIYHPGTMSQRKITTNDSPAYKFHTGSWTYEYYHSWSASTEYYHSSDTINYKYFGYSE
eukprot:807646_1